MSLALIVDQMALEERAQAEYRGYIHTLLSMPKLEGMSTRVHCLHILALLAIRCIESLFSRTKQTTMTWHSGRAKSL